VAESSFMGLFKRIIELVPENWTGG
jgi:hypothetical protein